MEFLISLLVISLGLLVVLRCLDAWGLTGRVFRIFPVAEGSGKWGFPGGSLPLWKVFLGAMGCRIGLLLAGMMAVMLLSQGDMTLEGCFQRLCQRWDGNHYVNLIEKGYTGYIENGQHLFLVFFPGYVWAVRLLRLVIPNTVVAGVTLSCFCYGGACCYLYRLAEDYFDSKTARDFLWYLSLFPFSFFSGMVMTEGLFLFLTAGACWYARKGNWLLFGLFGACAALTRMTGVLVIAPAFVELLAGEKPLASPVRESLGRCWKKLLLRLPLIFSPLLGTAGYLLLNAAVDGDPFAFVAHQRHWYQGYRWISQVVGYLWDYFVQNLSSSFGWAVWFPTLVLFAGGLVLLALAALRREMPPSLLVYGFGFFVATYSLSWLLSGGRYLSCCFPLFLFLARLTGNRPRLRNALWAGEALFLGIYFCAYISGAQVM